MVDVNASPGGGTRGKTPRLYVFVFIFKGSHRKPAYNYNCTWTSFVLTPSIPALTLAMNENSRSQSFRRKHISIISTAKPFTDSDYVTLNLKLSYIKSAWLPLIYDQRRELLFTPYVTLAALLRHQNGIFRPVSQKTLSQGVKMKA